MNERIDKLMHKAGAYFGGEGVDYSNFDPKKFAELIVAECANIVAKRKDQAIDDGCNVDEAMSMAGLDLLEHFGVEP